MARRSNRLSFDRLESRELMHGGVLASVIGAELFITEAVGEPSQDNAVVVSRLPNQQVRVSGGINSDGTRTLINGHDHQDFALFQTANLLVALEGGNDRLFVENADFGNITIGMSRGLAPDADLVALSNVRASGVVSIGTGAGADKVAVRSSTLLNAADGRLDIDTGADFDTVILTEVTSAGPVNAFTGAGADQVTVADSAFNRDLTVNTGAGPDLVDIGSATGGFVTVKGNLIVNTFTSVTEADRDVVRVNQTFADNLIAIDTGAGNDAVRMGDVEGQDVVLVAGVGNDTANLFQVRARDQMFLAMSEGNDRINMTDVGADNLLSVDGGTGFDRLEHHLDANGALGQFTGWEVVNGRLTGSHAGTVGGLGGGGTIG